MSATAKSKRPSAQPAPATQERAFEAAWKQLEADHAWRIVEERVHNPELAVARIAYAWQDLDNRRAAEFRERHRLPELVAGAANDWEAILRLRHWAFTHMRDGTPSFPADDPADIVAASLAGATFYCTYFAYAFVAAATSMGHPARHLGIDCEHEQGEASTHHGIADVWSNTHRKWIALDPNYDCHYELDGVPLNAEELGLRWRSHRGEGVRSLIGPDSRAVDRARQCIPGKHEACGYYWHYIDLENDPFHRRNKSWPNPVVFPVDEERRRRTWFQGSGEKSYKHGRYSNGSWIMTERSGDAYPDLNCTRLSVQGPTKIPHIARVSFGGLTPNFSHHQARVNGGAPFRIDGVEYPWRLAPGRNSLEIRAVNAAGHEGPASSIELLIEEDSSRKPEWPRSSG